MKTGTQPLRLFWLILLVIGGPCVAQSNLPIVVAVGKTAVKDLFHYRQNILIDGTVAGDVSCLMGTVTISGTVKGSVNVIGGDVVLGPKALVEGDLVCLGGSVHRKEGALVAGRATNLFTPDAFQPSTESPSPYGRLTVFFAHAFLLFLLVALCFYVFPNYVNEAGFHLSQDLGHTAIIGAVTWAALGLCYFLSFVLMLVAVGFPLLVLTLTATTLISVFGTCVVFYQLAQSLEQWTHHKLPLAWALLAAILVASLLVYVPILRELVLIAVTLFGAGATMETRFGTNKQWFTRKARYWAAG